MRQVVGSLAVLLALAALTGCSSSPKAKSANDVVAAMNQELAHTVEPAAPDTVVAMNDALAHTVGSEPVGTTMLTSATIADLTSPPILSESMPLPDDRMSLAELTPVQTWGSDEAVAAEQPSPAMATPVMLNLSEIPDTRE